MNQTGLYMTVVGFIGQSILQRGDSCKSVAVHHPEPDYYSLSTWKSRKTPHDPSYYPPPPIPAVIQCWYA